MYKQKAGNKRARQSSLWLSNVSVLEKMCPCISNPCIFGITVRKEVMKAEHVLHKLSLVAIC